MLDVKNMNEKTFNEICLLLKILKYGDLLLYYSNIQFVPRPLFLVASSIFFVSYCNIIKYSLEINDAKYYFKYKELIDYYNAIIDRMVELNKTFEFNNIVESDILLKILYYSGLLSYDFNIDSVKNELLSETYFSGAIAFNKHGVCRHTSALEKDIMEKLGYTANLIIGTLYEDPSMYEELAKENNVSYDSLLKTNRKPLLKGNLSRKQKKYGNHMICLINDGKNYMISDLVNDNIIKDINAKKIIYEDSYVFDIIRDKNGKKDYINYINNLIRIPNEEIKVISSRASSIIENNMDIVMSFYKDIKDILMEIEKDYITLIKVPRKK